MRVLPRAILLFALVVVASPVSAQYNQIFGGKAGVNVAGIHGLEDTFDDDNTYGLELGLFSTRGQGVVSFQGELNYSKQKFDVTEGSTAHDLDIDYLQGAALLKVGLPLGTIRPSAQGGVGYGFSLSCDYAGGDCNDDVDPGGSWVGIFGVDLEIWLGSLAIVADARYQLGFNEISSVSSVFDGAKSRTWIMRAGLGYRY